MLDRAGTYQQGEGQYNAAVPKFERAAALDLSRHGPDHRHTLEARNNLAYAYTDAGRTSEAITLYEQILPACVRILGPDHPHTLTTRRSLAQAYQATGRTTEAITPYEQILPDYERVLGPDHPDTMTTRDNLASAYREAGRTTPARPKASASPDPSETDSTDGLRGGPDPTDLSHAGDLARSASCLESAPRGGSVSMTPSMTGCP